MTARIAIVIPYFQRERGILRRSLQSVAAQIDAPLPLRIVVVDDASPVPASDEVEGLVLGQGMSLDIIRQPNAGPGAARNTGLDAATDAEFVAFLDSDDEWTPDHLARAALALDSGFDFYFANLFQLGQRIGAFERAGRISPPDHPLLAVSRPDLHAYRGDMFTQINFGNVIGTPTVVYRFSRFKALRFQTEFRAAGEDYLFWIALVKAGARVCFSFKVEAICGRGVNVYAGAEWGTASHLQRVHDESRYKLHVAQQFDLDAGQLTLIEQHRGRLRRDFAGSLLSLLLHRRKVPWPLLSSYFRCDPWWPAALPGALLRKVSPRRRSA